MDPMEPHPFHISNSNTHIRYAPIPPPSFSGDRNFYLQHLPPPPPPPPTAPPIPPPYHHHPPQFPFHNTHRPIEDDPRRHLFNYNYERTPRIPDTHHHPQIQEDLPHLPRPDFENPYTDLWDLPRVSPFNRPLVPFPGGFDHDPHHHPMSPYRASGNFVARGRIGEDPEGDRFQDYSNERNHKEELFWGQSDRGGNGNGNGNGNENYHHNHNHSNNNRRRRVLLFDYTTSRNLASSLDNPASRNGSVFDNGRLWNNGGDGVDENRRWNSSRDVHHSAIEMKNEETINQDGVRAVSGKHSRNVSKLGRFKNRVGGEGSQEFLRTPKKKQQKTSALLRIQLGKPTPRKRKDEQLMSSGCFDDSNSGSFRSKGPLVFSDHTPEGDREGSPVELDVSFKSNALVAKAIMAPSSPVVGTDGNRTPRNKKIWKVMTPGSGMSSLRVTESHERPVKWDSSTHGVKAASSSGKAPKQSEEKATVSGIGTLHDIGSHSCPDGVTVLPGNNAVEGSPKGMVLLRGGANVGSNGMCEPNNIKKRKVIIPPLGLSSSRVSDFHERPVEGDSSTHGVDAALSSDRGPTQSEEKGTVSGIGTVHYIGSLPSADEIAISLGNSAVKVSPEDMLPLRGGVNVGSDGMRALNIRKKRKVVIPPSGLSSSAVTEHHERTVKGDSSTHGVDAALSSNKGFTHSEEKVMFSDIRTVIDVDSSPSSSGVTVPLENNKVDGSPQAMVSVTGGVTLSSGRARRRKIKRKRKVKIPLIGTSSSSVTKVHKGPANADSSTHATNVASSFDKDLTPSLEKVTVSDGGAVDDVGSRPCPNGVTVSLDNSSVEESPKTVVSMRGVVNVISRRAYKHKIMKKSKVMNLSSSRVPEIYEGIINGDSPAYGVDTSSSSDKFPNQAEEKITVSDMGTADVGSQPCPIGVTISLGNSAVQGSPESTVLGFVNVGPEGITPMVEKKNATATFSSLSGPLVSELHEGTLIADAPSSFYEVRLTHSREKVTFSGIESVDDAGPQPCLNGIAVSLEKSRLEGSSEAIISVRGGSHEDIKKTKQPNMDLISFVEEPAFPHVQSPGPSGSGVKRHEDATPVKAATNCQDPLQYDIVDMQSGSRRKEKIELNAAEEHGMLARENCDVISAMHSQTQDTLDGVPLELQISYLAPRLPSTDMECYDYSLLVNDELSSVSNYFSSRAEAPGFSTTNSNEEPLESMTDTPSNINSSESLSMVPELHVLNTGLSLRHISNKNVRGDGKKPDEIPIVGVGSLLTSNNSFALDPKVNVTLDHAVQSSCSIPEKTVSLPSQDAKRPTPNLKLNSRESNVRKSHQSYVVPRVFPGRPSFISGSLKKTSSTHITKPRTWHRTDNPSASLLPGKNSSSSTAASQKHSPKKFGKVQSTSYIRKGNSLVRKSAPLAVLPQSSSGLSSSIYRLNPVGIEETKNTGSESKDDNIHPPNFLKTGRMNASIERPKTPPLPNNTKLTNCTTKPSQVCTSSTLADPLRGGGSEAKTDPMKLTENKDVPMPAGVSENQAGLSYNIETQSILNDGNSKSNMQRLIYVKRKSNQLVAASSPEECEPSVHNAESTQVLPSNRYYKRNKNQLIRTSSESHVKQAIDIHDDSSNSEGQRAPSVLSLKCSRNLSKRRSDKVLAKTCKPSKFSFVWTLRGTQAQNEDTNSLQRQKVLPYLFPWKRTTYRRSSIYGKTPVSNNSSFSLISRKLLLSRKRNTVYTRSTGGFSLRKSKVLSIGGSNLKWSKSIEKRSKRANEEATLAVAAVERKKREQNGAACAIYGAKNRNQSSRKSAHSVELLPGERIFRVGSIRYKMDSSKRTLQRISGNLLLLCCSGRYVRSQPLEELHLGVEERQMLFGRKHFGKVNYTFNARGTVLEESADIVLLCNDKPAMKVLCDLKIIVIALRSSTRTCYLFPQVELLYNPVSAGFGDIQQDHGWQVTLFTKVNQDDAFLLAFCVDEKSTYPVDLQTDKGKPFVPRRLLIGNDEYVRIGSGNQLVRDPKKRTRVLANEKIRWSLHTARLRLARKQKYCQFFTRFGKCNKDDGKCPYLHDPSKIAVCTKFLKGLCSNTNCKLTHKVIPERMQDCSYFLQGGTRWHVNVNPDASVCEGFLRGYCADGDECRKKHSYVCPIFESTGICPQGSKCKLHHPKSRSKGKKRKRSKEQKNVRGRYFGSMLIDIAESRSAVFDKHTEQNNEDIFLHEGRFADYISLDDSDEELTETNDPISMHSNLCDSDPSDLQIDLDELIKPIRIMNKNLATKSSSIINNPGAKCIQAVS
ncbi:hypothetical protein HHK36_008924 [Tetracentron sinense]|uniref:C3H1-type domain-containing protein n=1 Tax=Tetracentron sinense TaxID=13715 RepID=A0A834ZJY2_TETSI|nr:hypothetical protein HHK36_008924 [Tetracentron sinense]